MKSGNKNTARKLSKGERLNWAPLKTNAKVVLTDAMVKGKPVPESYLKSRQQHGGSDNSHLLVP